MVRTKSVILAISMVLYLMAVTTAFAAGTTYYVDYVGGNDANNGTSSSTAWKNLSKVNLKTFLPGDRILFKAGSVWTGQLWPKGSGTSGNPIVIDRYGSGNKPVISGGGTTYPAQTSGAVMLYNQQYWEINNLEVTNYSASVTSSRAGIMVMNNEPGLKSHIYIRNTFVHDVNSNPSGNKNTGGIIFFGTHIDKDGVATLGRQAGFNDVLVENNHVANVTKEGIRNKSDAGNGYPRINTKVVFRGNYVEEIFGDGMVLAEVLSGALAEYNTIKNHSKTDSGAYAGLWTHYTTGAVVQFNEVFGGTFGGGDGQAFDTDNECDGDIFQYNYSHDNAGGLLLVMPTAKNLTFRYNISQNDGFRSGRSLFAYRSGNSGNQIYNNVIYNGPGIQTAKVFDNWATVVKFYNNVIKADGTISRFAQNAWSASAQFKNNNFYPATIDDVNGPSSHPGLITADPLLVSPGSGASNIDMKDPNRLSGYKLQAGSPVVNAGLAVSGNGGKDFWGNSLYKGTPDIGASESSIVRMDSGSSSYFSDAQGRVYIPDQYVSGGQASSTTNAINNTTDDALYQTYRYGSFSYSVNLPNGTYSVYLKFVEPYFTSAGSRVFDVNAEGVTKLNDLDVYSSAGARFFAVERSFTVSVGDGQLNLNFVPSVNSAIISGIAVMPMF